MQSHQPIASTSTASSSNIASSSAGKPDRLYVGNLSPTVDEYTLLQVFSKYGKITKLDFMFHKSGVLKGKPRGFAFMQFANKDDALKAMVKLHDRLLRGRKLVVTYASSAPPENLPLPTKGRRPTEAAKTTTLSLLKSSRKPQSAAAQIAAMEAKLASMKRTKPADENWIPGSSGPASGVGSPAPDGSIEGGSPMPDLDDDMLGDEEGKRAALDLEKAMQVEMAQATSEHETPVLDDKEEEMPTSEAKEDEKLQPTTTSNGLPLPPLPASSTMPATSGAKTSGRDEAFKRGLASLPKKPAF
ncbi:hypothetical protein CI109_104120 [Kwoniella shandongensis]|uniref:Probable RNA-binding protein 18 n=1 Tax=Kwoniella shandongensis TaxID=1734106 RepID=A0A5M6C0Y9_9TREE|nr:uncharacterized protein CI109_002968 [Kwoniella shandongensis]KAA5528807.1 hypothetical protein CI109_002968 [Kwoniella shandongensis]